MGSPVSWPRHPTLGGTAGGDRPPPRSADWGGVRGLRASSQRQARRQTAAGCPPIRLGSPSNGGMETTGMGRIAVHGGDDGDPSPKGFLAIGKVIDSLQRGGG